ncbi:hypothetical protein BpHYR1_043627 [Brachionus plicatilis]|uniref:Uncharacterized protein n=1 Tax=Brachionus plicatilis TaxID=10195 RepID=A0A3M7PII4_BRAPC|nr:hypothetical protein BpHYR1_043627 [Brachionus plicatilis]
MNTAAPHSKENTFFGQKLPLTKEEPHGNNLYYSQMNEINKQHLNEFKSNEFTNGRLPNMPKIFKWTLLAEFDSLLEAKIYSKENLDAVITTVKPLTNCTMCLTPTKRHSMGVKYMGCTRHHLCKTRYTLRECKFSNIVKVFGINLHGSPQVEMAQSETEPELQLGKPPDQTLAGSISSIDPEPSELTRIELNSCKYGNETFSIRPTKTELEPKQIEMGIGQLIKKLSEKKKIKLKFFY